MKIFASHFHSETLQTGILANSENPNEMPHRAAFYLDLYDKTIFRDINILKVRISTCDPLKIPNGQIHAYCINIYGKSISMIKGQKRWFIFHLRDHRYPELSKLPSSVNVITASKSKSYVYWRTTSDNQKSLLVGFKNTNPIYASNFHLNFTVAFGCKKENCHLGS